MDKKSLFRMEVLENKRNKNYGSVFINTPWHYTVLTFGFSSFVILLLLFVIFGEFSEKFIVNGYLESAKGIARVYPYKNGVIIKRFVNQGDEVKKGDNLFLIDTSYKGLNKNSQQDILAQLEKKRKSIEKDTLFKKKHLLELKSLLEKKYIPLTVYQEKYDQLVALEQQKNSVDVEIINYKHQKSYAIRSPIDGVVSTVSYHEGQYANLTKPLAKILPNHTDLIAELFIPVRQSGFLHRKNTVLIRYDAYPFARFGTSKAFINDISHSILTDEEEDKPIRIGQPYYKVIAALDKQSVTLYGKEKKLQHGMTVSAVIIGSKRKVWQWILDPVYSFYGGISL